MWRVRAGEVAALRREKRILYAGAVSPHKGLHVLFDAFCMVVEEYPDVRLDVVGLQASYPLAENFELRDREVIETVYPFYAYDWTARLRAKLSLAPADAGTYLAHLKQRLSAAASGKAARGGAVDSGDDGLLERSVVVRILFAGARCASASGRAALDRFLHVLAGAERALER